MPPFYKQASAFIAEMDVDNINSDIGKFETGDDKPIDTAMGSECSQREAGSGPGPENVGEPQVANIIDSYSELANITIEDGFRLVKALVEDHKLAQTMGKQAFHDYCPMEFGMSGSSDNSELAREY